jgi:predicted nucleic acid-binding Zn ribbon protein
MAANELVREGVVICGYLIKECQHILEKVNKRKKNDFGGLNRG